MAAKKEKKEGTRKREQAQKRQTSRRGQTGKEGRLIPVEGRSQTFEYCTGRRGTRCRSQLPEIGGSWATSKSGRLDDDDDDDDDGVRRQNSREEIERNGRKRETTRQR
ncbi:hypothetical protein QLX08_003918 [Tetragonisca angustula]|uniref:Uncharacterized protein n=1 Tax=Tetragonisca angustula TaxID=166442 RepID=A0AAW1A4B7_9HYME